MSAADIRSPRMGPAARGTAPFHRPLRVWRHVRPDWIIPALAAALLVYLTSIPLAMLIWGSFQSDQDGAQRGLSLGNYLAAYTTAQTYTTFFTSVVFAGGSCMFAVTLGLALAWLVERTDTPLRGLFYRLALVPVIIPGVLICIAWIFLLSPKIGVVNTLLMAVTGLQQPPFNVFSLGGMIWVEGLRLSTLSFLIISASMRSMDPSLEEAAMMSGAGLLETARRVTAPLIAPAIGSAILIMFVQGIEAFEVPALLGIPAKQFVFTSEIFLALKRYPPGYGYAGALAVGLVLLSALGVWMYAGRIAHSARFETVTGKAFRPRRVTLGRLRWVASGFLLVYFLVVVGLPFAILVWASLLPFYQVPNIVALKQATLANYEYLFTTDSVRSSLLNTLMLGIAAATIVMLLTGVVSWIVVKTRTPGRMFLDYLAFVPIVIPGIVLGVGFIWFYIRFPLPIYGTIWVLIIAYVTRFLPFGMRAAVASMVQIHRELEEAAAMSGAGWLPMFRRVVLPLFRPGFVAGWIYICVISVRELSTSMLLATADNAPVSVVIFDLFQSGESTIVSALGVMLIVVLLLVVWVATRISGHFGVRSVSV